MLEEGGGGSLRLSGDRSLAEVDLRACGGDLECCLVDLALDLGTCGGGDTQFCLVDLALAGVDLGSCGGWFLSFVWWILSLAGVDLGACGGGRLFGGSCSGWGGLGYCKGILIFV